MISIPSIFRRFRPFFLLYLRPWLSIRPLPYAVARAIGNTNDMRFSYDHIADVRRVRMRPHGHGHLTRPRITPIHTLVRTHRLAASVRNPHAPAHMRTMRSAIRMVESRCETSSTALPLLRQRVNRLQNHGFVVGVEATRRLVEQHQRRVAQEDASQADALPFTL